MQTVRHNGKIVSHTNKMFLFLLLPPATKAPFSLESDKKNICGACLSSSCHASFLSLYSKIFDFYFCNFPMSLRTSRTSCGRRFFFLFCCMPIFKTLQKQYYFFVYIFLPCRASQQSVCSNNKIKKNTEKIAIELRDFNFVCASIL